MVGKYILIQSAICAIINMLVNPALAWAVNTRMGFVPLWGDGCIMVDTTITSFIMPLVVSLFTVAGVRRSIKTGQFAGAGGFPRAGFLLSRMPLNAWGLGCMLGLASVIIVVPLSYGLFRLSGVSGLPFMEFALFKVLYTGPLAFLITRWVIIRQLATEKSNKEDAVI
ncbi:MAG: hypothetical protein A2X48_03505 [Lentisphaerae bacterium GWF2_49_21]|nr:MAG: hypothetical protein A2X48_03505 [Lentisphaerae bacterium GWF2_49_21]